MTLIAFQIADKQIAMIKKSARLFMVVLAVAWILAPLHIAIEPHHWCAEHGVIENGEIGYYQTRTENAETGSSWQSTAFDDAPDHEKCIHSQFLQRTSFAVYFHAVFSTPNNSINDLPRLETIISVINSPIDSAPKTSPPTA